MQEQFVINGGHPLTGTVSVRGAKNAATKMMVATLLTDEECILENIPMISDIDATKELCDNIGTTITIDAETHRCTMHTPTIKTSAVPELSRKNRIPILAIGPLLHRNGFAEIPVLGGCPIGHRPINLHIESLNKMGIRIERREHSYYAESDHIHGAEILLEFPSVGATENILLTAVRASGTTTIRNAATEPEIANLIAMLVAMGAQISMDAGVRTITVDGVSSLNGVTARVMPDRNEIVSFAAAALVTEGDIFIPEISPDYLDAFLDQLRHIGAPAILENGGIRFSGKKPYRPTTITTAPHPAFMTDWQQPFAVILTQAMGESFLHETVYEERLGYLKDLRQMGAMVEITDECLGSPCRFHGNTYNHSAKIVGPTALHGAKLEVPDLRAGMAHVIAALAAEGESILTGIGHIDRGYESLDARLRALGANIVRTQIA